MAAKATQDGTTEATAAQGRFVVALPREVGDQIDAVASRMAAEMQKRFGVPVQMSRAQVVGALVTGALATFADIDKEATPNGAES
jgi:hypothetical protein